MLLELSVNDGSQPAPNLRNKQCYWKLNKSILEDKDFMSNFEEVIPDLATSWRGFGGERSQGDPGAESVWSESGETVADPGEIS